MELVKGKKVFIQANLVHRSSVYYDISNTTLPFNQYINRCVETGSKAVNTLYQIDGMGYTYIGYYKNTCAVKGDRNRKVHIEDNLINAITLCDNVKMRALVKKHGISNFNFSVIAYHQTLNTLLDHRTYLLNKHHATGTSLVNTFMRDRSVPKLLIVPISVNNYMKLVKYCINRKVTLGWLIKNLIGKVI